MALALASLARALPRTLVRRLRSRPKRVPPARTVPRLSIVIVNYCLWEETSSLVRDLLASPCVQRGDVEVVVVDNHSPVHPVARRLRRWSGVSFRRWGRNRGFARAVNEGCRLSRGQWLLLLNPDISVAPDFLNGVLNLADRLSKDEPNAGVVGFQLRNSDGTRQFSSGPFPTLVQTLARLVLPRTRRKYNYIRSHRRRPVPWVTGCCLMARRDCWDQLGGLDRDFFLYYEDVDLCRRAQEKGWSVMYEPALRVVHHNPLHLRPVPAYFRLLTRHALLTYAAKHWPGWQFKLLTGIVRCEAWLRGVWASRKGDSEAVELFGKLKTIATHFVRGRRTAARQCLEQVVRREERRRAS